MSKQASYKQIGDAVDLAISDGCSVGDVIPLTNIIGVALATAASGATIPVAVKGVFDGIAGVTGVAWAVGAKVYWDDSGNCLTTTSTGNTVAGVSLSAHASTAANSVTLLLNY